jgi:hypothetical protein
MIIDSIHQRFGMRELRIIDGKFMLNGEPVFLSGYGDDAIFPNTVCPPADRDEYIRRLSIARDYGFNYVRHHSHFPLDEYLDVADELGMLVQPEFPIGYAHLLPKPSSARKKVYMREWEEIIIATRNHPCIAIWSMGNEMYDSFDEAQAMYDSAKRLDPSRIIIDTDGSCFCSGKNEPLKDRSTIDFFTAQCRHEMASIGYRDGKYELPDDVKKPVVAHEVGYFATLPDLSQRELFNGHGVRPYWLLGTKELAKARGISQEYQSWLEASNNLHALSLKTNTEALRVSKFSGYSLYLLQDYPQIAEGILDMFFRPKALRASEFRQFNGPTVVLMDMRQPKRNFRCGETETFTFKMSHFGSAELLDATLEWELRSGDEVLATKRIKGLCVRPGAVQSLASVTLTMPNRARAEKLVLQARLKDESGAYVNQWNVWVYPKTQVESSRRIALKDLDALKPLLPQAIDFGAGNDNCKFDLLVTSTIDDESRRFLESGGRVLLIESGTVFPVANARFRGGSWNPTNLGEHTGTIIADHPSMRLIPNDGWCDLNWFSLLENSKVVLLDQLPAAIKPIVRSIDLPQRLANKGYLFEVAVGPGKLLVSSLNLAEIATDCFAAYLVDQLIHYALGNEFAPSTVLPVSFLQNKSLIKGGSS